MLTGRVNMSSGRSVGVKRFIILCSMVIFVAFSGCSVQYGTRINSTFSSSKGHMKASFETLTGSDMKDLNLKKGANISFKYNSNIEKGSLSIKLIDSEHNTVVEFETNKKGTEFLEVQKDDKYQVIVEGEKAKGSYDISWEISK